MDDRRGFFVCLAGILLAFGTLMVYSASITSWPGEFEEVYLTRHVIYLGLAVLGAGISSQLPARFWWTLSPYLFVLSTILLALVLVPGLGTEVNGARRWLRSGPLSMQPSELAKLALPLFLGRLICGRPSEVGRFARFLRSALACLAAGVIVVLVMKQPDLGTALFLASSWGLALFVGGWPIRNFLLGALLLIPTCRYVLTLKAYQIERVREFLAGWSDWDRAPYQLKQSLLALGSGGLFGVGLGAGWQKLSFLPEANTDFVFAVVGEELGLVGTATIVLLWCALYACGLGLLRPLDRRSFEFVAGFTLLTQLVMQALLNAAVVTALVPPKGIPHPFLSYGGSNLVVSVVSLGIVLSLARREPPSEDRLP